MAAHNDKLRAAREATPSRWFPGRAMTRTELAHLVAEQVWFHEGVEAPLDRKYIAKLETGVIRFPRARYRRALRAVLGARSDPDLGFVSINTAQAAEPLAADDPCGLAALAAVLEGRQPPDDGTAALVDGLWRDGDPPPPDDPHWQAVVGGARELAHLDRLRHDVRRHRGPQPDRRLDADLARVTARTEATGRHLLASVAELCQLAGLAAIDTGRRRAAAGYLRVGARSARLSADERFAAHLRSLLRAPAGTDGAPPAAAVPDHPPAGDLAEITTWVARIIAPATAASSSAPRRSA